MLEQQGCMHIQQVTPIRVGNKNLVTEGKDLAEAKSFLCAQKRGKQRCVELCIPIYNLF